MSVKNQIRIGTRGLYELNAPWSADAGVLYTCVALRAFVDLENRGQDVFSVYYEAVGLTQSEYTQDRQNGELIVTLISDETAPIYVPTSYIASLPDLSHYNYSHVILSASLGPLPDTLDLTFARNEVSQTLSDVIGVAPTVELAKAPMSGVITPSDHQTQTAARNAAKTNSTTERAKRLAAEEQVTRLQQKVAFLEDLIRDNGLI